MYFSVIKVKPLNDYKLEITFENNEIRIFDMKPFLDKGMYNELKNKVLFKTAKVSFDSVEWANGLDIDPEFLYTKSNPIESENFIFREEWQKKNYDYVY